jgi:hypothetical protein
MSNLTILHRIRQLKGGLRQPHYGATLFALEMELKGMGLTHPYRLIKNKSIDQLSSLLRIPEFARSAAGDACDPKCDFIYHLTSVRKAAIYSQWAYFPSGFPSLKHEDRKLFEYLQDDFASRGNWLQLSTYAQDRYSGFRGFTWWTDLNILGGRIICSAHQLGLPNKWVPKYGLVMRCATAYARTKSLPRVPTTVDGFISEIFSPPDLRLVPTPTYGRAIDLDSPAALQAGAQEYALASVPVDQIEFIPVLIDRTARSHHVVERNARLWQLLEIYYNKL